LNGNWGGTSSGIAENFRNSPALERWVFSRPRGLGAVRANAEKRFRINKPGVRWYQTRSGTFGPEEARDTLNRKSFLADALSK
jgi:hypothetical protein